MQYKYPGIRDFLMCCASYVDTNAFDHRHFGVEPKCHITTRDATENGLGQTLMNYLSHAGIKYVAKKQTYLTPNVYDIEFDLGQPGAEAIDETVKQMGQDREWLDRLNDTLEIYNPVAVQRREGIAKSKEEAFEQLQQMIIDFEGGMESSDGGEYFYFYFDQDDIEKAQKLFEILGMPMDQHLSRTYSIERVVLRYPGTMVSGHVIDIIAKLRGAINERDTPHGQEKERARNPKENFERGQITLSKTGALTRLKMLINRITRLPRAEELKPENKGKLFYCFHFDVATLDEAQKLLQICGMPTVRKEDEDGKTFLLYSVGADEISEDTADVIYEMNEEVLKREVWQNESGSHRM